MTRVVCDASALVAVLADSGPAGQWVAERMRGADLVAPHLALFETANVLRREERAGTLAPDVAALAHADLLAMPMRCRPTVRSPRVPGSCAGP